MEYLDLAINIRITILQDLQGSRAGLLLHPSSISRAMAGRLLRNNLESKICPITNVEYICLEVMGSQIEQLGLCLMSHILVFADMSIDKSTKNLLDQ